MLLSGAPAVSHGQIRLTDAEMDQITAGNATHLAFSATLGTTQAGVPISPPITVRLLDAFNNLAKGDNTTQVTVGLGNNPGGLAGRSRNAGTAKAKRDWPQSGVGVECAVLGRTLPIGTQCM